MIGGGRVPAADGRTIDSVDPSTGTVWAAVPRSGVGDVAAAVAAAHQAYEQRWRPLPPLARAEHLRRLAATVAEHAEELAELETRDTGRLRRDTTTLDLPSCQEVLLRLACAVSELGAVGVVGVLVGSTAPLSSGVAELGAALAAGDTVVLKPAEQAAASLLRLGELCLEAGLPAGVVNVVSGLGEEAGDALVRHPGVARVGVTGSAEGTWADAVVADADLGAVTSVVGSRILIRRAVFDEVVERIRARAAEVVLGAPSDPATTMGPLASSEQFDRVCTYLAIGMAEGADVVFGGRVGAELFPEGDPLGGGYYVEPTLFRSVTGDLRICREEMVGPVAVAIPYDPEEG